ncbi:MAG: hypothetical protein CM15mP88_1760 [Pseudomonadota bacterium]|nr:MAG: hypothetical protein CM15mP88_1760 [Pseudomonadota bacterium]
MLSKSLKNKIVDKGDDLLVLETPENPLNLIIILMWMKKLDVFEQALDGDKNGILQDFRKKMILKISGM